MINKYIQDFKEYLKQIKRSKSTIIAYYRDIEQIFLPLGNKDIINLPRAELVQLIDRLKLLKKLSAKSISRKINSLRKFYAFLKDTGIIKSNTAATIPHPKYKPRNLRILSKTECNMLRDIAKSNLRIGTMLEILMQTGLRISELQNLKIKDILGQNEILEISGKRKIPLNQNVQLMLYKYLEVYGVNKEKNSPLFYTSTGKNIEIRNIRSSIDKVFDKAKMRNVCVNDIRNTFIVYQLSMGMDIKVLGNIVGHKNSGTTKNYLNYLQKKVIKRDITIPEIL